MIPLSGSSLRYGSANAGMNVRADVPEVNSAMEAAARVINIKEHMSSIRDVRCDSLPYVFSNVGYIAQEDSRACRH